MFVSITAIDTRLYIDLLFSLMLPDFYVNTHKTDLAPVEKKNDANVVKYTVLMIVDSVFVKCKFCC